MKTENPNFDDLFEAVSKEFETAFIRSAQSIRPDEKGGPREEQLRQFLKDWLPQQYDVTNGYVINRNREISRQCDVIFYNSLVCPKFVLDKTTDRRLVPLADIYGTIEVKSTLGEHELADALEKIESVDKLFLMDSSMYAKPVEYDEFKVQAVEIEKPDRWAYSRKSSYDYIPDEQWQHYEVRKEKITQKRTPPFSVIFTYKLAKNFTLEIIEDSLKDKKHIPDAVVALDSGILMHFSQKAFKRYKSLKNGKPIDEYQHDPEVLLAFFDRMSDPAASHYIVENSDKQRETLLFFYAFLFDLLDSQRLSDYVHTDLLAVWRKGNK